MKKRALFGLGNPGEAYRLTRHNAGARVVEALAAHLSAPPFAPQRYALYTQVQWAGIHWHLLLPTTYMNLSGDAVAFWKAKLDLSLEEILIAVDELQLPLGTLRLSPKGSAGGHNGLAHIIEKLGTEHFPRLRIGIGKNFPKGKQVEYVLSPFSPEEERIFRHILPKAVECLLCWGRQGLPAAMNACNKRSPIPSPSPDPDKFSP